MANLKAFLILTVTVGAVLSAPPTAFKASEGKPVVAPKPPAPAPPPVAPAAAPPAPPPAAPLATPTIVPPTAPPTVPPAAPFAAPSYYYSNYYYDYPTQAPARFYAKKPDSSCKCDEMYFFTNRCRIGVFFGYCEEGAWCCDS